MAGSVTIDVLRRLSAFRAQNGCVISLFVGLDPSVTPTAGDADSRVNSLLSEAEKRLGAEKDELTHDQRQALRADVNRIRQYFDVEFDRDGVHGLAVFADGLDDLWVTLPLPYAVPDGVRIDRTCQVAPLVSLVGVGDGALVAVVGREAGAIYRLRAGRLEQVVDQTEEQPSRHDQGGWSQARFQRHIDNLAAEHMRAVAAELDRHVRRLDDPAVVVVATEENRGEFEEMVAQETRAAVAGWTQAEAHATPAQLLEVVAPVLDESRARRQEEVLARWREEAGRAGRAASGWAATLDAASDSRVDVLLFREGAQREAWQCPRCGRAAVEAGQCPLDGAELERRDDGLDLAIRHTLANGGRAVAINGPDLDPVEGIGALLRF